VVASRIFEGSFTLHVLWLSIHVPMPRSMGTILSPTHITSVAMLRRVVPTELLLRVVIRRITVSSLLVLVVSVLILVLHPDFTALTRVGRHARLVSIKLRIIW
jgi:hypothetical protein